MMNLKPLSLKLNTVTFPTYQNLFLRTLAKMNRGRLEITLTSGEIVTFGAKEATPFEYVAKIRVLSDRFFKKCILFGDIGFGESYTDGDWETSSITDVIRWMILNWQNNPEISGSRVQSIGTGLLKALNRVQHLFRDNDREGSVKNIRAHYDLGNQLFETFLDPTMTYSCADFSSGATTLEEAQIAKFNRLARAIRVKKEDHVLEIGGGWGAFAILLAKNYGARVTSISVSKEQLEMMRKRIIKEGLDQRIEALFLDYREVQGQFDKIVSVEMIEAVGHRHLPSFFQTAERVLKPSGLMGIQAITCADSRYIEVRRSVDWIQKHIFPGSLIPSLGALTDAARSASQLQMHSLHNLGANYALTLRAWRERFESNRTSIKSLGYDDRFTRAWNYYFSYCEAAFTERHISAAQIVYTRPNNSTL